MMDQSLASLVTREREDYFGRFFHSLDAGRSDPVASGWGLSSRGSSYSVAQIDPPRGLRARPWPVENMGLRGQNSRCQPSAFSVVPSDVGVEGVRRRRPGTFSNEGQVIFGRWPFSTVAWGNALVVLHKSANQFSLAEGLHHRSLGHRPRNLNAEHVFGRRPYSTGCNVNWLNMAFGQT